MTYHDSFSLRWLSRMWAMKKKRRRRNKRCIPKEGMSHAQKACQKKKKNNKDAYPKKVCHMPTRHVKKKKKEKDSPHPWKIKKRDGSCKGVHPSSTQKKTNIPTHLHILIKLYDSFLLGSCFWLSNRSKASMPLYSHPELHISLIRW